MDPNIIVEKMKAALAQQNKTVVPKTIQDVWEIPDFLPKPTEGEFIERLKSDDKWAYICFKELTWAETLEIDAECHKNEYYAGELDAKLTLSKCIVWLYYDNILINEHILKKINESTAREIEKIYRKRTTVTAEMAAKIYSAATKYFKNEAQNIPIDPLIVKVDLWAQGGMIWSEKDLDQMPNSKMEKIKIILSARNELIFKPN